MILGTLMVALLALILFWVGKIFFAVEKGLQETIKGMNSIEERLAALEKTTRED